MSVRIISAVWDGFPGSGSELLALLALADWADDEGRCFPSISAIARKIRLKERQAQRIVHKLIDDGFIRVTGNQFGGAPGTSRQYRIVLDKLTGVAHDTPMRETGVMEDADGCHGRRETGVTHDTLTVIEPSITVKENAQAHSSADKKAKQGKSGITLKAFLDACKTAGQKPIPEDDPIFSYAEKTQLTDEMLAACWREFKSQYLPTRKTQRDWRAHYRNAVRRNWYKLWFIQGDEPARWTTAGEQARRAAA